MGFARTWARASARRHLLSLVGIAVLLAVIGGLALFTIAGARRTQSAYTRFLRAKNPSTLVVDIGGINQGGQEALDGIKQLPQVASAKAYVAYLVAEVDENGPNFEHDFEALGSTDGRFFDQDVFTPTAGRMPDPTNADEVVVNEEAAKRYGYHVGQQLELWTISPDDLADPAFEQDPKPRVLQHATIVGVGLFIEEVVQDDTDKSPLMVLTPAYTKKAKGLETYAWDGLVLKGGAADVGAVKQKITDESGTGAPQIFRETRLDEFHALQAMRPISLALAVFGLIAGLAAIVLAGQAIGRHVRAEREERAVARAMGAAPGSIGLASAIGPIGAVVVGTLVAVGGAIAASPLMPIGPVRKVEVDRGIDVDWTAVGLGALVLIVTLSALTVAIARAEQPHRVQRRAAVARRTPGIVQRVRSLPIAVTTGLRLAFEPGDGASAVPVRSVMAGVAIAVTALVAAVTFGASMSHLVSHPSQYGWDWDLALVSAAGYGNTDPAANAQVLGGDPDVASYGGGTFGGDTIDGRNLPELGIDLGSEVTPPIRTGRMITSADEVVLGTATIAQLHKHIGDQVSSSSGPLTIVGTATFPTVSQVHGDHTSLGIGAIVETKLVPGWQRNCVPGQSSTQQTTFDKCGPNILFVRFHAGVDKAAATSRLTDLAPQLDAVQSGIAVLPPQRSAEIVNADDISGSSTWLGVAVAIASLVALGVALTSAVRRRRRDLALLKSLGFTRRQLSSAVAWQATGTIAMGLIVGIPGGVVIGRVLWGLFANQLDVLADPVTPALACLAIALAAIVAANILAAIPARFARRVPAALVLRSE
ncbi:MAG: putative transport system permease protein [Acidimicrobiaceae bacterium]